MLLVWWALRCEWLCVDKCVLRSELWLCCVQCRVCCDDCDDAVCGWCCCDCDLLFVVVAGLYVWMLCGCVIVVVVL